MIILSEIESLEYLKAKGPFHKVKASINELIPIKARGWDQMWLKIKALRSHAECYDLSQAMSLLGVKDEGLIKKYLWLVTISRRKYNLYISSKYEGIDYFKYDGEHNEIQWH